MTTRRLAAVARRCAPRTLRVRLTLVVVGTVAAALLMVVAYLLPQLEQRLRQDRLDELAVRAERYAPRLAAGGMEVGRLDRLVSRTADLAGTRLTLLGVDRTGTGVFPLSDSTDETKLEQLGFGTARRALRTQRTATDSETSRTGQVGEAAVPLRDPGGGAVGRVAVFTAPLEDIDGNVALVRDRLLLAGLGALLASAIVASLVAGRVSRRVVRLETAARQVAAGDFGGDLPPRGNDELGRLVTAFDDMRRQLAQLDQARKRFVATASHELRTPLFSLAGFVELLRDEELDEETRARFLAQIAAQVDRLTDLSTDLLDLSRLEAGAVDLRAEPIELGAAAEAVVAEFEPARHAVGAAWSVTLPRAPVRALGDRERTVQILRILLDNALVHTPPGTPVVVSVDVVGGRARLRVTDGGPGIEPDRHAEIFLPFATSALQGAGLGLAIARELAERMHGRLAVASRPGHTTFTLELPGA